MGNTQRDGGIKDVFQSKKNAKMQIVLELVFECFIAEQTAEMIPGSSLGLCGM